MNDPVALVIVVVLIVVLLGYGGRYRTRWALGAVADIVALVLVLILVVFVLQLLGIRFAR